MVLATSWLAELEKALHSESTAVDSGVGARLNGTEIRRRAGGMAEWLDAVGARSGRVVPALVSMGPGGIALTLAGAATCRPLAPLGTRLTAHELARLAAGLEADLLLTEPATHERAQEVGALLGLRVEVVPGVVDGSPLDLTASRPDDLAVVLHTSGTSGLPKAVPVRQDRLARRVCLNAALLNLAPGDTYLTSSPFHHIAGFGLVAMALAVGATVRTAPAFSVHDWPEHAHGVTHAMLVPTMVSMLLDAGTLVAPDLRVLQYGAAPMPLALLQRVRRALPDVDMVSIFGQTEGSPLTCLTMEDHRQAAEAPWRLATVGRAVDGVELRVEDRGGYGRGELIARADHLFRPDDDGWLRTGDLASVDGEGYVTLHGRARDLIIRGGENVSPEEVEGVLAAHPDVDEAAVAAVPDERLGQTVGAWVVPREAGRLDVHDLRTFARARLSGFKVPQYITVVASLPRNASGKLLRRELRLATVEA